MNGTVGVRQEKGGAVLIAVTARGRGERVIGAAREAGARGGTIALGRHPQEGGFLGMLGLGDADKDIAIIAGDDAVIGAVAGELESRGASAAGRGAHLAIMGMARGAEEGMDNGSNNVMVVIIVNSGAADEAMDAARKAGASGGTIINARGTGREEDAKFFGITIFPEKEVLLIVAAREEADAIIDRVRALESLAGPGSGIAFTLPVRDYITIGA